MKIVCDDKIPFLRGVFEPYARVTYLRGGDFTPEAVRDADALIVRTRTRCDRQLLAGSRVKCVATATIGFDHIKADELAELGIAWSNAPGCNAASVAQYVASVLLSFRRGLKGKTLGVVGVGNVGRLIVKAGEALGMTVLQNDPLRAEREGNSGFADLEKICRESDFITLHVPKVTRGKYPTVHLADDAFFAMVKPGAVLLNASRGDAVDENALKRALASGRLAGCALDVWEKEPEIDRELLALADFATPHIAGYSTDGKANGTTASVRYVARFFGIAELENWSCTPPAPLNETDFRLSCGGEAGLLEAMLHTFDLESVCRDLKLEPEKFEQLRGAAPIRREPASYRVINPPEDLRPALRGLGFNIVDYAKEVMREGQTF